MLAPNCNAVKQTREFIIAKIIKPDFMTKYTLQKLSQPVGPPSEREMGNTRPSCDRTQ